MAEQGNHNTEECERLKPNLTLEEAANLTRRLYNLEDIVCRKEFTSYDNQNILLEARRPGSAADSAPQKFVLKLTNNDDSEFVLLHQKQCEVLELLRVKGVQCSWPIKNVNGELITREQLTFYHKDTGKEVSGLFLTRVMKHIPGQVIRSAPVLTAKMCYEAGQLLGRVTLAFQDYEGDKAVFEERGNDYLWSLSKLPEIKKSINVVQDETHRRTVEEILDAFNKNVWQKRDTLQKGFIHGDFNDYNILIKPTPNGKMGSVITSGGPDVVGCLDFDDMSYSYLVYDIAIAIMYIMQCEDLERDPLECGGILLAGYLSERSLDDAEWGALYYCIAARFAQSLVLGLESYSQQPQNDYLLSTQVKGWQVTLDLWSNNVNDLCNKWKKLFEEFRNKY